MKGLVAAFNLLVGSCLLAANTIALEEIKESPKLSECIQFHLFKSKNSVNAICSGYSNTKVKIFDVSNPEDPIAISTIEALPFVFHFPQIFSIDEKTYVYFRTNDYKRDLVGNNFLAGFDITDPAKPEKLFETDLGITSNSDGGGAESSWGSVVSLKKKLYYVLHSFSRADSRLKIFNLEKTGLGSVVYEAKGPLAKFVSFGSGDVLYLMFPGQAYKKEQLDSVLYQVVTIDTKGAVNSHDIKDPNTTLIDRCTSASWLFFGFNNSDGNPIVGAMCSVENTKPKSTDSTVRDKVILSNFEKPTPTVVTKMVAHTNSSIVYGIDYVSSTGKLVAHGFDTQITADLSAEEIKYSSRTLHHAIALRLDLLDGKDSIFSIGFGKLNPIGGKKMYQHQADVSGTEYQSLPLRPATGFLFGDDEIFNSLRISANEIIVSTRISTTDGKSNKDKIKLFRVMDRRRQ